MTDYAWARTGRVVTWSYGALAIAAGVLITVVSVGIPPTDPDLDRHYAYIRQVWPELYISFLLFMVAFACLIAIAVVLREFFGRGVRTELLYTWFLAAGIVACCGCWPRAAQRRLWHATAPASARRT